VGSLQDRLVESLIKDIENLENITEPKIMRKELALLASRVESAKKLFSEDEQKMQRVRMIEEELTKLKGKL